MKNGGKIVVDADELLKLVDKARGSFDELSSFLARGLTTKTQALARQRKAEKASKGQPFELRGFDIGAVDWKKKDRSPAGPNEVWAWGFATDREGFILNEVEDLFNACKQYGEVRVGSYLIKIGGRDKNLLNRKKLNYRGR